MAKDPNALLVAVSLIEHVQAQTKVEERAQLSRAQLEAVKTTLNQTLAKLNEVGVSDVLNAGIIIELVKTIEDLLGEANYSDTDTDFKVFLASNIDKLIVNLYLEAGRYYTKNEMADNVYLHPMLSRIVHSCLDQGYYFGMEEMIKDVQSSANI